jgi:hypothetical protein
VRFAIQLHEGQNPNSVEELRTLAALGRGHRLGRDA